MSQWVLHKPTEVQPTASSSPPQFNDPYGGLTDDPGNAEVFSTEADAKNVADKLREKWQSGKLGKFWQSK
jgi:hypothetical protein